MVNFRRPAVDRNGAAPPPEDPDRWTISKTPEPLPPSDEVLLLRQLLAAQKEQLLWSQRTAIIVREIRTVPFWSLVGLFVKAAFAAIPAAIIVAVIVALVNAVIAGVLAALVGALLLGASSGQRSPPVPTSPAPTAQPVAQAAPVIRLVVPGVIDPCVTASTYMPASGQRAVGVQAVVSNDTGAAALDIAPLNFTVIGSDDLVYAPLEGSCDSQIGTSRLAQGESTSGTLVFALPAGVQIKSLRFKPTSSNTFIETSAGAE